MEEKPGQRASVGVALTVGDPTGNPAKRPSQASKLRSAECSRVESCALGQETGTPCVR